MQKAKTLNLLKIYFRLLGSPVASQWIGFLVLLVLLLWAAILFDLSRIRDRSTEQSRTQISNLLGVYAEEVQSSVALTDYVLKDLREHWQGDPLEFASIVQHRQIDLDPSLAYQVAIVNANGTLIFSSLDWNVKPIDLSDRQHFKFHLKNYGDQLFISEPVLGRISNRWAIQFTRPLRHPSGAFAGIIVLSVSPEYFSRFHESIDLGDESAIILVRRDGKLLARSPDEGNMLGKMIRNVPYLRADAAQSGFFYSTSELDGVNRLYGWKLLPDLDSSVVIGQSNKTILEPYFRARLFYYWTGSALTLLLVVICFFRLKHLYKQEAAAAELAAIENALNRAQKMEALGQLTGGVAHDFNNILQVISSNVEMLEMIYQDNQMAIQRTQNALQAVDRGSKLATQLLTFARRQPLQTAVVNLGTRIQRIDGLIRGIVGSGIDLHIQFPDNLHNVEIDPSLFENVVLNLAANARDAMHGKGKLVFQLNNIVVNASNRLNFHGINIGQYVRLSVTDTGDGMEQEVIDHAFEPFFTTKPEGMGTGLGLSMAFGFVKQSNGYIYIESQLKQGTAIHIYLPVSSTQEIVEDIAAKKNAVGGNETILLVDDDPDVEKTITLMLRELGYRVLTAHNAKEAINILQQENTVQILLTDLVMPGDMDGLDLGMYAKAHFPALQVLLTSGYSYDTLKEKRQLDKTIYVLRKPYRREELDAAIHELISRST